MSKSNNAHITGAARVFVVGYVIVVVAGLGLIVKALVQG